MMMEIDIVKLIMKKTSKWKLHLLVEPFSFYISYISFFDISSIPLKVLN
jgi:hypothetical protein